MTPSEMSDTVTPANEPVIESHGQALEDLEAARDRLAAAEEAIEEAGGETQVERGAHAYRNAAKLLDTYVDKATGSGRETFKHYIHLEGQFSTLVEQLPEDLPKRAAFEASFEAIDKRRLNESDFERAKTALEPARELADLIDEREGAEDALREARTAALTRLETLESAIDRHERLLELGAVDIDAPVDRLRDPLTAYNEAVREAFEQFLYDQPARAVFALLERSRWHPFAPFERPPAELRDYVETTDAGAHSIPTLLEYANYSRSKLAHHVDDPDELKRRIATRQTYLERLDGEPLCLPWPPGTAEALRIEIRDVRPLAERVGGQPLVDQLRVCRELTRSEEYDRLQTAAQARTQITSAERERLAAGVVERDLETLQSERDHLEAALDAGA